MWIGAPSPPVRSSCNLRSVVQAASGPSCATWVQLQSRVWRDRGQDDRLNSSRSLAPSCHASRCPQQSITVIPGNSCQLRRAGSLAAPLAWGQVSDEAQAFTARRRLWQVARSWFLPGTADTTRSRWSGRLSSRGGVFASMLPPAGKAASHYFALSECSVYLPPTRLCPGARPPPGLK